MVGEVFSHRVQFIITLIWVFIVKIYNSMFYDYESHEYYTNLVNHFSKSNTDVVGNSLAILIGS